MNDTLPVFMSRNYTLQPFTIADASELSERTWSANTTMYSLELLCEVAETDPHDVDSRQDAWLSTPSCSYIVPSTNNSTIGDIVAGNPTLQTRKCSTLYRGYWDVNLRDWDYDGQPGNILGCKLERFAAALAENRATTNEPAKE